MVDGRERLGRRHELTDLLGLAHGEHELVEVEARLDGLGEVAEVEVGAAGVEEVAAGRYVAERPHGRGHPGDGDVLVAEPACALRQRGAAVVVRPHLRERLAPASEAVVVAEATETHARDGGLPGQLPDGVALLRADEDDDREPGELRGPVLAGDRPERQVDRLSAQPGGDEEGAERRRFDAADLHEHHAELSRDACGGFGPRGAGRSGHRYEARPVTRAGAQPGDGELVRSASGHGAAGEHRILVHRHGLERGGSPAAREQQLPGDSRRYLERAAPGRRRRVEQAERAERVARVEQAEDLGRPVPEPLQQRERGPVGAGIVEAGGDHGATRAVEHAAEGEGEREPVDVVETQLRRRPPEAPLRGSGRRGGRAELPGEPAGRDVVVEEGAPVGVPPLQVETLGELVGWWGQHPGGLAALVPEPRDLPTQRQGDLAEPVRGDGVLDAEPRLEPGRHRPGARGGAHGTTTVGLVRACTPLTLTITR